MRYPIRVLAAAALGAAFASAAQAQDMTTYSFGGTTLYIGGGFQYLTLPDIRFTGRVQDGQLRREKNIDFSEYGGSAGAGIETALGYWNGMRITGGVKGFWSSLENSDRSNCRADTCFVADPNTGFTVTGPPVLASKTHRDVDYWGGSAELKFGHGQAVHAKPNLYRNDYFIVGADIRGIDQSSRLHGVFEGDPIYTYRETLDTTYVGGYVGLGGEYSFGFIPGIKNVGGIHDRLGLRTFINVRAGLYNAETDYDGRYSLHTIGLNSKGSMSSDDLAFIGTVSLETRKQIGLRTSLSLWTDYEFISSVPKMRYGDFERPTRIEDDDAFATRTMLRLNVGLGSSQLYAPPPPP